MLCMRGIVALSTQLLRFFTAVRWHPTNAARQVIVTAGAGGI
jgi:hypothetical protein